MEDQYMKIICPFLCGTCACYSGWICIQSPVKSTKNVQWGFDKGQNDYMKLSLCTKKIEKFCPEV